MTLRDAGDRGQKPYEINISLFSAFAENLDAYMAAHTLLLSFQGITAFYIHSLLATRNDRDLVERTGRTRSINRGRWRESDLEAQLGDPDSPQARTLAHSRRIIACRDAQPALAPRAGQSVPPSPPGAFLLRRDAAEQRLVVAASMLAEPQQTPLHGTGLPQGTFVDLLSGRSVVVGETLSLAPYEVLWLDVTQATAAVDAVPVR